MIKRILIVLTLLYASSLAAQVGAFSQYCQLGGLPVNLSGINSTTLVQVSYPNCTVSVYLTGTTTLATIYATVGLQVLTNPFVANTDGSFTFFASQSSLYDVVISGGNMPVPFTFPDVEVSGTGGGGGGGGGGGTVTSVAMTVPPWLNVTGTPIVVAGTLAITSNSALTSHQVLGTFGGTSLTVGPLAKLDLPFTYSGPTSELGTVSGALVPGNTIVSDGSGNLIDSGTTAGSGTVTAFSSGNLSPLFTTSVNTATTTPALSFSLSTASAHKWFGNNTGSTAAPGFQTIGTPDLPYTYSGNTLNLGTTNGVLANGDCVSIDASGNLVDAGVHGCGGAGGTVTSVAMTLPSWLTVTGSPIVTAGTLAITPTTGQTSHQVLGTFTGSTFIPGSLTTADLPFTYGGNTLKLPTTTGALINGDCVKIDSNLNFVDGGPCAASGTVTSVTFTGDGTVLSSTPSSAVTTTGTLTAALASFGAHKVLGNFTGSPATPTVGSLTTAELPFTYTGNTTKLATGTGSYTNGHCVSIDASGNLVDFGSACSGAGTGGTVTSVGFTAPTGYTVTGSPVVASGTIALATPVTSTGDLIIGNGANSSTRLAIGVNNSVLTSNGTTASWQPGATVSSVGLTVNATSPSGIFTVTGSPITGSGTLNFNLAGTSGGVPYFSSATVLSSSAALTANLPVLGGGAGAAPTVGTKTGNTNVFATATGALINGHCAAFDANGNIVDSGNSGCTTLGTVTSVALAAPTGFTVTNSPVTTSGTLTWAMPSGWTTGSLLLGNGANSASSLAIGANNTFLKSNGTTASWATAGTVTSVAETFTGGLISVAGSPITGSGTFALTVGGTSGGVPYFSSASTWASSGALTLNKPVIGGGAGAAPTVGSTSGNTTIFGTTKGTLTNGDCVSIDANGNLVDSGVLGCAGGGGGGSIVNATQYAMPYYSGSPSGITISGVAAPTAPAGVPQTFISVPSGGLATAGAWSPAGVSGRAVTGTTSTDTIISTDCSPNRVEYTGSVAVAVTLPTATTLAVPFCVFRLSNQTSGGHTVTVTPTTWTCNGASTCAIASGQFATFYVDPLGTNWVADISTASSASGTVTSITATSPLSGGTITTTGSIGITANGITATQLAAQYSKGQCTEVWGGSGAAFAMQAGDDAISNNTCYNDSGVTRTITALKCRSDNAANTTVLTPTFGSAGTGTAILTGTLTCGNSYTYSATGTLNNTAWTTGTGIDPGMSTVGNATSIAMIVEFTY